MMTRASSITQHVDFHAAPRTAPFTVEFAACCGKRGIARFRYIFI